MFKKAAATPAQTQSSGCPVMKSGSSVKNDAEEIIDPTNMMPNMSQVRTQLLPHPARSSLA